MTRDEFKKIVAGLRTVYATHNFMPTKEAFEIWFEMLKDLPFEVVNQAAVYHIQTEKFPPTVADLRRNSMKFTSEKYPSELDAWNMVSKALRNGYYGAEKEFAKLPPIVQEAVGSPSNIRNWSQADLESVESVISSNFMRTYRIVCKRAEEQGQTASYIREQLPVSEQIAIEDKQIECDVDKVNGDGAKISAPADWRSRIGAN